jgi:hypothetical protein
MALIMDVCGNDRLTVSWRGLWLLPSIMADVSTVLPAMADQLGECYELQLQPVWPQPVPVVCPLAQASLQ